MRNSSVKKRGLGGWVFGIVFEMGRKELLEVLYFSCFCLHIFYYYYIKAEMVSFDWIEISRNIVKNEFAFSLFHNVVLHISEKCKLQKTIIF